MKKITWSCRGDSDGVTLCCFENGAESQRLVLAWEEISQVSAFKRDLFTIDQVCLSMESDEGVTVVSEDTPGWKDLINILPLHLPGFPTPEDWMRGVIQPPFEQNLTFLWRIEAAP